MTLHIYLAENSPEVALIMHEEKYSVNDTKCKKRKRITFIKWNLTDDSFVKYKLIGPTSEECALKMNIDDLVYPISDAHILGITTLRMIFCRLNTKGGTFICSVADYSHKRFLYEHYSFILHINQEENTIRLNKVVFQPTSYDKPPSFFTPEDKDEMCVLHPEIYTRISMKNMRESDSHLVCSSSGPTRFTGIQHTKTFTDYRGRVVHVEKDSIFANELLLFSK